MSGLVAAWACSMYGHEVVVVEPRALGGDFLVGGLKYIHRTTEMETMLNFLEVPSSHYTVRGGLHIQGVVEDYPDYLSTVSPDRASQITGDHFRKTRGWEPGDFGSRSMNDPGDGKSSRRAIRCSVPRVIEAIQDVEFIKVREAFCSEINTSEGHVIIQPTHDPDELGPRRLPYTKLVLTLPLWVLRKMCDFHVPEGVAVSLNIVQITVQHDPFAKFDYVYTPYTPGNAIHRISPRDDGYSIEANGVWEEVQGQVKKDLAWLFPAGYIVESVKKGLKGHLLPLPTKPQWPENVLGVGRFATWNPRNTIDHSLKLAIKKAEQWWGEFPL